jgi:hypothetical protein
MPTQVDLGLMGIHTSVPNLSLDFDPDLVKLGPSWGQNWGQLGAEIGMCETPYWESIQQLAEN